MSVGVRYAHKWLDKTIEDVGIQVAGVGEVFMIANPGFGIAEYTLAATCPTCPAQPPAKRDYDAVEFRLRKRLSNRWSMNTSYVYSALRGNYSGLTSSDENGRNSPSVLRFFDGLYMSFDSMATPSTAACRRIGPTTSSSRGLTICPGARWSASNTVRRAVRCSRASSPTRACRSSTMREAISAGHRSTRRPICSSSTTCPLPGRTRVNVGLNVINLFDQDTVTRLFQTRYRDQIAGVNDAQFFQGFDHAALAVSRGLRPDARYTLSDQYLGARTIRVQATLRF